MNERKMVEDYKSIDAYIYGCLNVKSVIENVEKFLSELKTFDADQRIVSFGEDSYMHMLIPFERPETDEEVGRRIDNEKYAKMRRYEEYLKLKQEFEGD